MDTTIDLDFEMTTAAIRETHRLERALISCHLLFEKYGHHDVAHLVRQVIDGADPKDVVAL